MHERGSRVLLGVVLLLVVAANVSVAISQIALGLALLTMIVLRRRPPRLGVEAVALAFFVWAAVMVPFSEAPARSFEGLKRFYLFSAMWVMATVAFDEVRRRWSALALLGGAVLGGVGGLVVWLAGGGHFFGERAVIVSNAMTSGALLLLPALVALAVAVRPTTSWRGRSAAAFAFVVLVVLTASTMTRSAMLALLVGVLVVVAHAVPRRAVLVAAVLALVLGLLVFEGGKVLPDRLASRWEPGELRSGRNTDARLDMWRAGLRMVRERPWTGFGDVSLGELSRPYYDPPPERVHGHMHSNVVQIAVIWGLPGLVLYLAFFGTQVAVLLRRPLHRARPWAAAWCTGALAATVAFFVAGFTEWYFGDAEPLLLAMIVYGVGAAPHESSLPEDSA